MDVSHWKTLLIIGLLLAGCSPSSDSGPEEPYVPPNVPAVVDVSGVADQKHYDSTVPFTFEITDTDGFTELRVEYSEGSSSAPVWSETRSSGTKFEKSWLPSTEDPAAARLEWSYVDAHPNSPEQSNGSIDIQILDTRFAEGSFAVRGRFGGRPDGHYTVSTRDKKKISTIEIVDGEVNYDRSHKIESDSLEQGFYVHLIEAPGYVTQRAPLTGGDVEIVPWKAQDWDYQVVLEHLMDATRLLAEQGAVRTNERWPDGSEVDVLVYDEQYFEIVELTGLVAKDPENPDFLPNQRYIDGSIASYSYLDDLLPQIKMNIKLQSESEEVFPKKIEGSVNKIFVGGWPDAPYPIYQSDKTQDGAYVGALEMQRTDPVNTSPFLEGGILADAAENLGIRTTGQENSTVDIEAVELLPFGVKNLLFRYDRPIGSGHYEGVGIPGSEGLVDVVHDYIPN